MTPSWYDVLDVDPDSSTEEIRAAWKAAIGDLAPGHRRFRALNDAAEVLLDPRRRAEHDAQLAQDAPVEQEAYPSSASPSLASSSTASEVDLDQDTGLEAAAYPLLPADTDPTADTDPAPTIRWAPPVWLVAALFVLAGALVGLCAWQLTIPTDSAVRASTRAAQASAERAATAVLSFDYRDLDASEATAASFLTDDYRRTDYEPLFEVLRENAPSTQTVVTVEVVASGIVRSGEDRVSVLVFVNRPTLRAELTEPEVYRDQVTMEMVEVDGEWLVDAMDTNEVTP
ncbi:MAG: J domain-containing protein [Nocardioides sp.]|nr:J domain-containing protein [Nocardioides sp.]